MAGHKADKSQAFVASGMAFVKDREIGGRLWLGGEMIGGEGII